MLTQSTAVLILAFFIGCSMTTVAGHKNKGDKSAGFPGNVMRAAGTCPQGTRLVVDMNSPGLLTGNFLPRCEPFTNAAFPLPNAASFSHPAGVFRQTPLPAVPFGHSWKGFNKSSGKATLKSALHSLLSAKLAKHAVKHAQKARF